MTTHALFLFRAAFWAGGVRGSGEKRRTQGTPVLCNPALTPLGTKLDEGCLSVTGMRSLVPAEILADN